MGKKRVVGFKEGETRVPATFYDRCKAGGITQRVNRTFSARKLIKDTDWDEWVTIRFYPDRHKLRNGSFSCHYNTNYHLCTSHYIQRCVVEEAVLNNLKAVTTMARAHEAEFIRFVQQWHSRVNRNSLRRNKKEQTTTQKRLAEIDRIINGLFESKVSGDLSPERFTRMLAAYEDEQSKLRERNVELMTIIAAEQEATDGASQFISLVKQFTDIQELTPEIVSAFIEKVIVHEAVKVDGKKKTQEIRVQYNFIGDMSQTQ